MTVLIGFLLIYLSILGGAIFISSIFNKKIELTIAVNIGINVLILYLFGLVNLLLPGVYIIVALNIVLGIIGAIIKKKKIIDLVCTPGLAFFTIVYFVLFFTNFNKALVAYDHFLYRSLNVKMMFNTNSMFEEYRRLYQPVSTLIEYFFMRLIGVYKQGIEAFAMQMLGISMLLPMYENVKKSKFVKIAIGFVIICLPAIFYSQLFYESSYPDATLGLLLAYLLYVYLFDDNFKFKILAGIVISSIMVLTKPTGIALMLIATAMLAVYEILKNKYYKKENIKKILKNKNFIIILLILISTILAFASWKIAIKLGTEIINTENVAQPLTKQPTDRASVNSIEHLTKAYITTIFGKYEENNGAAYSNGKFLPALYYGVVGFIHPIELSFVATSIIIFMAYAFYYYKVKDMNFKNISIMAIVGFILYMLFLQMFFAAGNLGDDFTEHYGLDRYAPAILIAILNLLMFIIFRNLSNKEYKAKPYIVSLLAIMLITPLSSVANATITSGIYNITTQEQINIVKNRADKINRITEEKAPVITIAQKEKDELRNLMMQYYLYPDHKTYVIQKIKEQKTIEDLINRNEYKYIYVYSKDENLEHMFIKIFNNKIQLKDETLYEINYNKDGSYSLIEKAYIDSYVNRE